MKREDAQEALLGGGAMGYDPASLKSRSNAWPKIDEAWSAGELISRNTVNLLCRPSNRTRGAKVGIQRNDG